MKIGILTFHRAYNFGAFLQAFALKSFLEQQGHQVEFVDYWPKEHALTNRAFRADAIHSISGFVRECLLCRNRWKRYRQFAKAQQTWLGIEKNIRYTEAEALPAARYDCVVYGSDQIWWKGRLKGRAGFDAVYWGDFLQPDIRRIAYAASMGIICLDESDKVFIQHQLEKFRALSVRETSLADALAPLASQPIKTVIDPTLLMGRDFWEKHCQPLPEKSDYILYYKVMGDPECDKAVSDLSRQTGLKVITLLGSINTYRRLDAYSRQGNPFTFVSLVRNARFVVSTSFHGVAFSILFGKPFAAMGMGNNTGRVQSLLAQLGLEDCLVKQAREDLYFKDIDFSDAHRRLENLRADAANYLNSSLEL